MKKFWGLCFLLTAFLSKTFGQLGGQFSYSFVERPVAARQMALGGRNISSSHGDAAMFSSNPSLLSDSVSAKVALSYAGGLATHINLTTAHRLSSTAGTFGLHLQNINYGTLERTDASGQPCGTFTASDLSLALAYSHKINHIALGASTRIAQIRIDDFIGHALFFDIGATFFHPKHDLKFAAVIKNIGFKIREIVAGESFRMPVNALVGTTYKPKGMPLRFSLTAHHLNRFMTVAYDDPNFGVTTDIFGNQSRKELSKFERFSSHLTFGVELVISPGLNLRGGYDFLRRSEMKLRDANAAGAGLSFGLMIRIKSLEVAYSRIAQVTGIADNCISLMINTKTLFKKNKITI